MSLTCLKPFNSFLTVSLRMKAKLLAIDSSPDVWGKCGSRMGILASPRKEACQKWDSLALPQSCYIRICNYHDSQEICMPNISEDV